VRQSEIIAKYQPTHAVKVTGRSATRTGGDFNCGDESLTRPWWSRYYISNLDAELREITAHCEGASQTPILIVQSTPQSWTLLDGVTRSGTFAASRLESLCAATRSSEVVGWKLGVEQNWLFENQDEAAGRPMERVLFENCVKLNPSFTSSAERDCQELMAFRALVVDPPVRNAENALVSRL
jgi:hypothetical protein